MRHILLGSFFMLMTFWAWPVVLFGGRIPFIKKLLVRFIEPWSYYGYIPITLLGLPFFIASLWCFLSSTPRTSGTLPGDYFIDWETKTTASWSNTPPVAFLDFISKHPGKIVWADHTPKDWIREGDLKRLEGMIHSQTPASFVRYYASAEGIDQALVAQHTVGKEATMMLERYRAGVPYP